MAFIGIIRLRYSFSTSSPYAYYPPAILLDETFLNVRDDARKELEKFAKSHARVGVQPECFVLEGDVTYWILAVRGRNVLDLSVFGSTTYRVIQLGPCPVLAVHDGKGKAQEGQAKPGANAVSN